METAEVLAEIGIGGGARNRARNQQLQLQRVAAVERKLGDALFIHRFANRAADGFDQRDGAGNLHRVGGLADLQNHGGLPGLVGVEADRFGNEAPEPCRLASTL